MKGLRFGDKGFIDPGCRRRGLGGSGIRNLGVVV